MRALNHQRTGKELKNDTRHTNQRFHSIARAHQSDRYCQRHSRAASRCSEAITHSGGSSVTLTALYGLKLRGRWRSVHVTSAAIALYLNVFIAVVQAFQKVVAILRSVTPTQADPPVCNCPRHRLSCICRVEYRCGQAISSVARCERAISLRSAPASSTSTLQVT
jgi:hypothetical protein